MSEKITASIVVKWGKHMMNRIQNMHIQVRRGIPLCL